LPRVYIEKPAESTLGVVPKGEKLRRLYRSSLSNPSGEKPTEQPTIAISFMTLYSFAVPRKGKQMKNESVKAPECPRCGGLIPNDYQPGAYPGAISRLDNKTEICSSCGTDEAIEDYTSGGVKDWRK
jgi:hypothetical protein